MDNFIFAARTLKCDNCGYNICVPMVGNKTKIDLAKTFELIYKAGQDFKEAEIEQNELLISDIDRSVLNSINICNCKMRSANSFLDSMIKEWAN
jgi:hypothetical protein